jgi:hypothetical protein
MQPSPGSGKANEEPLLSTRTGPGEYQPTVADAPVWHSLFPSAKVTLLEAPVVVDDTIVSFDPGRTTGIAVATRTSGHWIAAEVVELVTIWRVLHACKPAEILFERFHGDNPAANDEALDVRGVVKLYRDSIVKPKVPPKIWWQPREAKEVGWLAGDKLKNYDALWVPGKGHDRDALRHLVWHLVERKNKQGLLAWTKPG